MNRLAHFLNKVWLNRRQRVSVQYFRRYCIKDYELDFKDKGVDDKAVNREMSFNRLVNQCEPEHDPLDKRIVYEMTGQKLDDKDY